MKELDLLKNDWQKNDASFEQLSENDIYKMIHKKSSSIVKWILILSILELAFWTILSFALSTDEYSENMNYERLIGYYEIYEYFSYVVLLVFIYLFYKNYRVISTTTATKQLMQDIIKTRKTVNYYVYYNLSQIVLSVFIGFFIAFKYNPETINLANKIGDNYTMKVFIFLFFLVFLIVFLGVFWLFYRLLYGRLLKRLVNNYRELKKIDL